MACMVVPMLAACVPPPLTFPPDLALPPLMLVGGPTPSPTTGGGRRKAGSLARLERVPPTRRCPSTSICCMPCASPSPSPSQPRCQGGRRDVRGWPGRRGGVSACPGRGRAPEARHCNEDRQHCSGSGRSRASVHAAPIPCTRGHKKVRLEAPYTTTQPPAAYRTVRVVAPCCTLHDITLGPTWKYSTTSLNEGRLAASASQHASIS